MKVEGKKMTKIIAISTGQEVLVSDEDYHWLSQRTWYLHGNGYAMCDLWGRRGGMKVLMHRLILLAPDTSTVDHANGNRLDNRRENLRLATQSQQNANRPKITGLSQYKGVHKRQDNLKWVAQIKDPNRRTIHLGSFTSEVAAAIAYDTAAIRLYGQFARLNFRAPGTEFCHEGKRGSDNDV
jgi:hypothetical protein